MTSSCSSELRREIADGKKRIAGLEARIKQIQHDKTEMEQSASFRIGRMLTWVPRKLRDIMRHGHGRK